MDPHIDSRGPAFAAHERHIDIHAHVVENASCVGDSMLPVQGASAVAVATTNLQMLLPLKAALVIFMSPLPSIIPANRAVQPIVRPDLLSTVEPFAEKGMGLLPSPGGVTVNANAGAAAASSNAKAEPTGMNLHIFIFETSLD